LPEIVASRYKIEKLLGEGAAGKVYLVEDKLEDNRKLALKLLEAPGARHLELMRHEFSILTKLKHPNIARVYDFGFDEESGFWFYTSEYVEGKDIIKACKKLDYADKSRLFAQLLRALQHIHSRGVIHYDVKPGNIIINKEGIAKLIDFGLATTKTPVSGAMRGTIGYAAPEVVRGELGDPRSDLYSLGVVTYQALTGRRPFESDSVLELLRTQATSEPEPPRKFEKDVPVELERIVLRLLEREPAARYHTAGEVNRTLSQAMSISLEEETAETAMAYLLSGGFVGRDKELKEFQSLIDSLREGFEGPSVRFITGETGIGKSRLMQEIGYYSQLGGAFLVRARCMPSQNRPFGPFSDVMRSISGTLPKEIVEKFVSTVGALTDKTKGVRVEERGRIIHETALLLMEVATRRPLMISIDNMEEAEEDALALLEYLAQMLWLKRQEGERVALLVICGCNMEAASAKTVPAFIERMKERRLCRVIALDPLSKNAGEKLLSSMLGGAELPKQVTRAVLDTAGGNPLIIEQVAQQLFESGFLFYEAGKWRASAAISDFKLPAAGEEALLKRVETLSDNERTVVEALACIGRAADFGLLSGAVGIPVEACAGAVEQLLSRRLLYSDEESNHVFTSGGMTEVILNAVPPERRRTVHERIYLHLDKADADIMERALHAEMADIDESRLIPLLWDAVESAERTAAMSTVIKLFEALRRRLPTHTEEWFKALQRLTRIYFQSGKLDKVIECIKAAEHDSLWKYPDCAAGIVSCAVSTYRNSGTMEKAEKLTKKAEKKLGATGDSRARAIVLSEIAQIAEYKGDMKKARKLISQARGIFASRKDTEEMNLLDYRLAMLDLHSGRYVDASRRIRLMLKRKSAERLYISLHLLLGAVLSYQGKPHKALEQYRQTLRMEEEKGRLLGVGYAQANLGTVLIDIGEYEKALDAHTAAKRLFQVLGDEVGRGASITNSANAHFALGRTKEALSLFEQAMEVTRKTSSTYLAKSVLLSRGWAYGIIGNAQAALADIDEALQLARRTDSRDTEITSLCERAFVLAFLCGDPAAAEKDLAASRSLAEGDDPVGFLRTLVLSARISTLKGESDTALELIKQARKIGVHANAQMNIELAEAEALLAAGKVAAAKKIFNKLDWERLSVPERIRSEILNSRCAAETGETSQAGKDAAEALKSARQAELAPLTFQAVLTAAACAVADDDTKSSTLYISEAEETFEKIAAALPGEYEKKGLRSSPFYRPLNTLKELLESREPGPPEPVSVKTSFEDFKMKKGMLDAAGMDERNLTREAFILLGMVSRMATANLEVQELLSLALGMVLDATGAERGFIILVDDGGSLKHLAARNVRDEEITSPEYETSHTMVKETIRTCKPRLVVDTSLEESLRNAKSIITLGLSSVLTVPIIHEGRAIGVVYIDSISLTRRFTEEDLALIEAFSERIAPIIIRAIEQDNLKKTLRSLQSEVRTRYAYTNIIGRSKPMQELFRTLDSVTDTNLTVYIYGETGTGKELVAKALHYNGNRRDAPFISINCGAMTESLLESELFGHVKGAFTGAVYDKAGLIESASSGTLFLDEIGSMPPEMQVKLLRVIEEREVRRIGAPIPVPVDIRLVCSANTPLEKLVEDGLFREDLFYRINVVRIELPPLRERREDIPLLVEHFLDLMAKETGEKPACLDKEAMKLLEADNFPGNVRELENRLRQAVALASGDVIMPDQISRVSLKAQVPTAAPWLLHGETIKQARDRIEKEIIISALVEVEYNFSEAAKRLGIHRSWLYARCDKLGIKRN